MCYSFAWLWQLQSPSLHKRMISILRNYRSLRSQWLWFPFATHFVLDQVQIRIETCVDNHKHSTKLHKMWEPWSHEQHRRMECLNWKSRCNKRKCTTITHVVYDVGWFKVKSSSKSKKHCYLSRIIVFTRCLWRHMIGEGETLKMQCGDVFLALWEVSFLSFLWFKFFSSFNPRCYKRRLAAPASNIRLDTGCSGKRRWTEVRRDEIYG